jgi:CRP/FNR family cyclic AMP-dependent transcriptional regulator
MVDLSSVRNAAILQGLDQSHLTQLAAIASERDTREGEMLFARGQEADTFYIARRGRFALALPLRVFGGHTDMPVEETGALDAFGWSSLVEPHRSIYSAYCTFDGAVFAFPGDQMRRMIESNDRLGHRLSANLNKLIGARIRAVQDLWVGEVEQSTARIQHWTQSDMSSRLERAVKQQSAVGAGWRRLTRAVHPVDRH